MNNLSDNLLSIVARFSEQLGPLATLIDTIVDRMAPKGTAQASCPPPGYCYLQCTSSCCANCSGDAKYIEYAYYGTNCASRCIANCTNLC